MIDLSTTYLGLKLKNPLVASASPLSEKLDSARRLEDAGASAIVMYSLFEEQVIRESLELDRYLSHGTHTYAEALTYLPEVGRYSLGPEAYVENVYRLKQATAIPIIGSLNGVSTGGWIQYAQQIEQAGADAVELNIYYLPVDPNLTGAELEDNYVTLVRDLRRQVSIPIAVKLSPFFTSMPNMALKLVEAGADGLVLFNRFYQPDFDLDELEVVPNLQLSTSAELRLPLRWIALLYGRVQTDYALTSGVHTSIDMLKAMMAGACVTMVASEFLKNGIERATDMLDGMLSWMEENEYESVMQMKGSMSAQAVAQPNAFKRTNYMKVLSSYNG
jgi:dihydroorotate dehydrogenase (fumarate)